MRAHVSNDYGPAALLASQTRRTLESLERERNLMRQLDPELPPTILGQLAYRVPDFERALKALEFSTTVIEERATRGREDMARLLHNLAAAPRDAAFARVTVADEPAAAVERLEEGAQADRCRLKPA